MILIQAKNSLPQLPEFDPLGEYCLGQNGSILFGVETPIFRAALPISPPMVYELMFGVVTQVPVKDKGWLLPGFQIKVERPPIMLLHELVQIFREDVAGKGNQQLETMAYLTWDEQNRWQIAVPDQNQSAYSVNASGYTADDQIGMVLHTHGFSVAKFSPTDDRDETAGMLYAVIGRLHQPFPEMKVRVGAGGCYLNVEVTDVFDIGL